LREFFARGEYVGWLASSVDAPGQVIAGAGVQLRHTLPHPSDMGGLAEGRHALIINVFTEPEWRRRGLGELLLKGIIDWSVEQKLDRLLLHSSEQGRRLYERLGFVQTIEMKLIGAISEQPEQ
jgi:GNAT superfamily N-acetyltransferase